MFEFSFFIFFIFLLSKLNRLLQNKKIKLDVQPASPMCPAHPPATTTTTTDPSTTHVVFFLFSFLDPLGLTPSIDSRLLFSSGLLAVFPTPFVVSNFLLYHPICLERKKKKRKKFGHRLVRALLWAPFGHLQLFGQMSRPSSSVWGRPIVDWLPTTIRIDGRYLLSIVPATKQN